MSELREKANARARVMFDAATEGLLDGFEWTKSERYEMYTMYADQLAGEILEYVFEALQSEADDRVITVQSRIGGHALAPKQAYELRPFVDELIAALGHGAGEEG